MSNDFDLDDDEDIDFDDDEQFEDGDDDAEGFDDEPADETSDVAPAKAAPSKPFDPDAKVPFFKNWIWWCSLITAVPGAFLCIALVLGMVNSGGQFNWMMWLTAGITFFCGFAVSVLPILIALGFFLGGKEVAVTEAAPAAKQPESASSADADDDDAFEDDDDDDLYEDDDDDADFDAFEDDDF